MSVVAQVDGKHCIQVNIVAAKSVAGAVQRSDSVFRVVDDSVARTARRSTNRVVGRAAVQFDSGLVASIVNARCICSDVVPYNCVAGRVVKCDSGAGMVRDVVAFGFCESTNRVAGRSCLDDDSVVSVTQRGAVNIQADVVPDHAAISDVVQVDSVVKVAGDDVPVFRTGAANGDVVGIDNVDAVVVRGRARTRDIHSHEVASHDEIVRSDRLDARTCDEVIDDKTLNLDIVGRGEQPVHTKRR